MTVLSAGVGYGSLAGYPCSVCQDIYISARVRDEHMAQIHGVDKDTNILLIIWKRLTWREE